jgi:hypothetical protein
VLRSLTGTPTRSVVLLAGLVAALVLVAPSLASAAGTTAAASAAHKRIGPNGGVVRARSGAALYVPPGALRKRAKVSITPLPGRRIDFHIGARWRGHVAVTMPRARRGRVVGHEIAGVWLPEGRPGQRTVWVSTLSRFEWIKAKAKAAACFLTLNKKKLLECLITKLGNQVSKEIGKWIAEKLGGSCMAALVTAGVFRSPGAVFLAAFMDPACVGHAGEGDFHFPQGPSPLPVGDNNGGSQTPTVNPQGPTVNPQTPQPTPVTTLTVYNKVTNGPTEMREDTPAYLSTRPANFCKRDGCAIGGTDRATGGTYSPAVCTVIAARTTNGNDGNTNDDGNPGLFSSTRWYGIKLGNGALGYISEVWIQPSQRGGLGLPGC